MSLARFVGSVFFFLSDLKFEKRVFENVKVCVENMYNLLETNGLVLCSKL